MSRLLLGATLSLLGSALMAQESATVAPVTFPLQVVNLGTAARPVYKLGIYVGLGGGAPKLYEFDTGAAGFFPAYSAKYTPWWTSFKSTGESLKITYDSGITYDSTVVTTKVDIYASDASGAKPVASVKTNVGQIEKVTGSKVSDWEKDLADGTPPLYGHFYGDFGAALFWNKGQGTSPNSGLYAIFPQLGPNTSTLGAGFIIHLGNYANPLPTVQLGFTAADLSRFSNTMKMNPPTSAADTSTFPIGGGPTYNQQIINGIMTLNQGESSQSTQSVGLVLDTGDPSSQLHTYGYVTAPSPLDNINLIGMKSGSSSQIPLMQYDNGDLRGLNELSVTDKVNHSSANGYLNTGLNFYFQNDVLFNLRDGTVGVASNYQSPYRITIDDIVRKVDADLANREDLLNANTDPLPAQWYSSADTSQGYGPANPQLFEVSHPANSLQGRPILNAGKIPRPPAKLDEATFQAERLLHAASTYIGTIYQHHHNTVWNPYANGYVSSPTTASNYWYWNPVTNTPTLFTTTGQGPITNPYLAQFGQGTAGIDCSDFVSLVYNLALGIQLNTGVTPQGNEDVPAVDGGIAITPKGELEEGLYIEGPNYNSGAINQPGSLDGLFSQLQPGDLLYINANPNQGLNISHVVMWLGPYGTNVDGTPSSVPLVISSHDNTPAVFDFGNGKGTTADIPPPGVEILPITSDNWFYQNLSHATRYIDASDTPQTGYAGYRAYFDVPYANKVDFGSANPGDPSVNAIVAGHLVELPLDTGSRALYISEDVLSDVRPTGPCGHVYLNSSARIFGGRWTTQLVTFTDAKPHGGASRSAIANVSVLVVQYLEASTTPPPGSKVAETTFGATTQTGTITLADGQGTVPIVNGSFTLTGGERVYYSQNKGKISSCKNFGVGFDRTGVGTQPVNNSYNQQYNAFLNLLDMQNGNMWAGYVLHRDHVQLGLTDTTTGYAFTNLLPTGLAQVDGCPPDWQAPTGTVEFDGQTSAVGQLVIDIGIPSSILTLPGEPTSGSAEPLDLTVNLLNSGGAVSYSINSSSDNILNPSACSWFAPLRGNYTENKPPIQNQFFNTGRHTLNAFDFLYDGTGGYVGLLPNGVSVPSAQIQFTAGFYPSPLSP